MRLQGIYKVFQWPSGLSRHDRSGTIQPNCTKSEHNWPI